MRAPTPTTPSPCAVLRWLVLATFVAILNETTMVNAIPRLMVEFDVTARDAQWLSTAFMLTMATVIPVTGWFLQRVSTRAAFTVAMATFMTGTLIYALAPVFWLLVSGRVVQAAGTAVMVPLLMATLMTALMTLVPEHDRGRVMGNVTLAISVAPALGPTISGLVLPVAGQRGSTTTPTFSATCEPCRQSDRAQTRHGRDTGVTSQVNPRSSHAHETTPDVGRRGHSARYRTSRSDGGPAVVGGAPRLRCGQERPDLHH